MANKIYQIAETSLSFKNTGGDITLTLTSVGSGAGRISAEYDKGAGAKWTKARIWLKTKSATQTVVGQAYLLFTTMSDGTNRSNALGASDAAVSSANDTLNLNPALVATIYDASSTPEACVYTGICLIPSRQFSVVFWNATDDALSATAGDHEVIIEPIVDEIQ